MLNRVKIVVLTIRVGDVHLYNVTENIVNSTDCYREFLPALDHMSITLAVTGST